MDAAELEAVAASVKHYQIVTFDIIAGEPGFEPRLKVLETSVLPLYYSPKKVGVRGHPLDYWAIMTQESL